MRPPLGCRFEIARCGLALLLLASPLSADDESEKNGPAVKTGKERMVSKADDRQRVDDCKVPIELRDPDRPRPDDCGGPNQTDAASTAPGLSLNKP